MFFNTYIIIVLIAAIIIDFILAKFMVSAAEMKGHGPEAHVFAMVFWLGLLGCLYVIALPDLNLRKQNEEVLARLGNPATAEELPEI